MFQSGPIKQDRFRHSTHGNPASGHVVDELRGVAVEEVMNALESDVIQRGKRVGRPR